MKPYIVKTTFTVLLALTLLMQGCGDSEPAKTESMGINDPRLIGTWRQTAIGKEQVSGILVKLIFAERTLTMDAPGCLIIGDYTAADGVFTYTVTDAQGERCAKPQGIGQRDSVHYRVENSNLFLKPVSGGEESQTAYKRIAD